MFLDLGTAPPSNAYLTAAQLSLPEVYYPLQLYVCDACWLVQLPAHLSAAETFTEDYAYFSSYSQSWLLHAEAFVASSTARLSLGSDSFVVEVASNDGYLLQYVKQRGIRCLGVEPTASTAKAAKAKGIETAQVFLGIETSRQIASQHGRADLVVANNVIAHVPDLHDFIRGLRTLLAPSGSMVIEFPHLLKLMESVQFDTVYHEHFSYFSLWTLRRALAEHALQVYDVDELETHGGSLRLWVCHANAGRTCAQSVDRIEQRENAAGLRRMEPYTGFQGRVDQIRDDFIGFLQKARRDGAGVAAFGAAAKGNTLLNYCGVRRSDIEFVCDSNPHKQGKYLPGSRIAITHPRQLLGSSASVVVVLPWNLLGEIRQELLRYSSAVKATVVAIPRLQVSPL
jgi:SAM-dependent methyltransferase